MITACLMPNPISVEADGTKLFYSGDIRGHGRKSSIFEQLVRDPPTDVDVFLMEGTNIRPGGAAGEAQMSETDVEVAMAATMRATSGMTLVMSSAQNIDRLVTIDRAAALQSGRDLVMDLYGASIVRATQNVNIPQPGPDWPRVHVYVPMWQRVKVKTARAFNRVGRGEGLPHLRGVPGRTSVQTGDDVQHEQCVGSRQGGSNSKDRAASGPFGMATLPNHPAYASRGSSKATRSPSYGSTRLVTHLLAIYSAWRRPSERAVSFRSTHSVPNSSPIFLTMSPRRTTVRGGRYERLL